jgi:hypothetical protein
MLVGDDERGGYKEYKGLKPDVKKGKTVLSM